LTGTEALSTGFTYTLSCLSDNASLELKDFIGLPARLAILTAATATGSDGGFSRCLLTLQDPLAILARRINSRGFQDMTVRDISAVIVYEHRQHNGVLAQCVDLRDQCRRTHPKYSRVTQFLWVGSYSFSSCEPS
jgi:type VI secretion system secreted protein VgrG